MVTGAQDGLAAILRAVAIHSKESISIFGEDPVAVRPQGLWPQSNPHLRQPGVPLVLTLTDLLYARCYCRALQPADANVEAPGPPTSSEQFLAALSQANHSSNHWDSNWRVIRVEDDGRIQAEKGERTRMAMPGEYAFAEASGMRPQVGTLVSLNAPAESSRLMPGFFFVFSDALAGDADEFHSIRFYFNATCAGAPLLVETITRELNHCQVPFRLKCMDQPQDYQRTDACVMYIGFRYFQFAAWVVSQFSPELLAQLEPASPLFTKTLRPGVSVADDPITGASFGQHRCRLLADALVEAWQEGVEDVEAKLQFVRKHFSACGLDLDRPYLNAGSVDVYELPTLAGAAQ